jgi:hypothetical protein
MKIWECDICHTQLQDADLHRWEAAWGPEGAPWGWAIVGSPNFRIDDTRFPWPAEDKHCCTRACALKAAAEYERMVAEDERNAAEAAEADRSAKFAARRKTAATRKANALKAQESSA